MTFNRYRTSVRMYTFLSLFIYLSIYLSIMKMFDSTIIVTITPIAEYIFPGYFENYSFFPSTGNRPAIAETDHRTEISSRIPDLRPRGFPSIMLSPVSIPFSLISMF